MLCPTLLPAATPSHLYLSLFTWVFFQRLLANPVCFRRDSPTCFRRDSPICFRAVVQLAFAVPVVSVRISACVDKYECECGAHAAYVHIGAAAVATAVGSSVSHGRRLVSRMASCRYRSAINGVYGSTLAIKVIKDEMPPEEHESFKQEVYVPHHHLVSLLFWPRVSGFPSRTPVEPFCTAELCESLLPIAVVHCFYFICRAFLVRA
jgi:hypothetical protein